MNYRSLLVRHDEDGRSLKRLKKVERQLRDSLQIVEAEKANITKDMEELLARKEKGTVKPLKEVQTAEKIYEKTFITPPPAYDQPQLDSLRRAIIARGYRQN